MSPTGPRTSSSSSSSPTSPVSGVSGVSGVSEMTDVVLEGGGVKGIALVGALQPLAGRFGFARIAGTSAGAIVGSVLAAMQQRGEPISRLDDIARTLDYGKLRDRGFPGKYLGPLGVITDALGVVFEDGAYEGDYLRRWLRGVLGEFDVHTFGDLRLDDPGGDGQPHHAYRLVVVASDLSRHRIARFPWDYDRVYGLDPDEQSVVEAVRASASVPYLFEPVELKGRAGTSTLVDGGLLSNYPISIFDRTDSQPSRWPTIGVRLDAAGDQDTDVAPVHHPVGLGVALVQTAIEGSEAAHVLDPCNVRRTVVVDTGTVGTLDFSLTPAQTTALLGAGRAAGERFTATWDYDAWKKDCG